jgi:hypothetical protein
MSIINILYLPHQPGKRYKLFVASSEDGTFRELATGLSPIKIGSDPAMTVFQNKLYIAFKANDASNQLHVVSCSEEFFSCRK